MRAWHDSVAPRPRIEPRRCPPAVDTLISSSNLVKRKKKHYVKYPHCSTPCPITRSHTTDPEVFPSSDYFVRVLLPYSTARCHFFGTLLLLFCIFFSLVTAFYYRAFSFPLFVVVVFLISLVPLCMHSKKCACRRSLISKRKRPLRSCPQQNGRGHSARGNGKRKKKTRREESCGDVQTRGSEEPSKLFIFPIQCNCNFLVSPSLFMSVPSHVTGIITAQCGQ